MTFFYSCKDWKSYTRRNMWLLFIVDMVIAGIYNYIIYINLIKLNFQECSGFYH